MHRQRNVQIQSNLPRRSVRIASLKKLTNAECATSSGVSKKADRKRSATSSNELLHKAKRKCMLDFRSFATINDLPDSILKHMLSYLCLPEKIKCERVCQRWNIIIKKHCWTDQFDLNYASFQRDFTGEGLKNRPRGIVPNTFGDIADPGLISVLERCGRYVRNIDFRDFRSLKAVVPHAIALHAINLTSLHLCCTTIAIRNAHLLGKNCRFLERLTLFACRAVASRDERSPLDKCMESFFMGAAKHGGSKLKYLDLSSNNRFVPLKTLQMVPPTLEELVLDSTKPLDVKLLFYAKDRCPLLHRLDMCRVRLTHREKLSELFENWNSLRSLNLNHLYSRTNFHDLELGVSDDSDDDSDDEFGDSGYLELREMNGLRELDASGADFVTDRFLTSLASGAPQLTKLELAASYRQTGPTTHGLSSLSRLRNMEVLDVSNLENFNDAHLWSIAANGKVKVISFPNCRLITTDGFKALLKNSTHLEEVSLWGTSFELPYGELKEFGERRERAGCAIASTKLALYGRDWDARGCPHPLITTTRLPRRTTHAWVSNVVAIDMDLIVPGRFFDIVFAFQRHNGPA